MSVFVLIYGCVAEDPFLDASKGRWGHMDDLIDAFPPETQGRSLPPEDAREAACGTTCRRIVDCGLLPDVSMCEPWCRDDWDERVRTCVVNTACDRIEEACFERTPALVCGEICARAALCSWRELEDAGCVDRCLSQWSRRERDCLTEADCATGLGLCLNPDSRTPCPGVCDKLRRCGIAEEEDLTDCAQICEEEMDDAMRNCVLQSECDEIENSCVEGELPDELCFAACEVVAVCHILPVADRECIQICEEQWDEEVPLCLIDVEFCDLAPDCMDITGAQCALLCDRFILCGELEELEYEPCVEGCPTEFRDEERECLMASECDEFADCLEVGEGEAEEADLCPEACSKMARCELISPEETLDCEQSCLDDWSEERKRCVLDTACPLVAVECTAGD